MGILDTQNLATGTLLSNFSGLTNKRAPFGKKAIGALKTGATEPTAQEGSGFGGYSYSADGDLQYLFGADDAQSRVGPDGTELLQGDNFGYGPMGSAKLSDNSTTLLGQAADMIDSDSPEWGEGGGAAAIKQSWVSSSSLRSLRNVEVGSGSTTPGYDKTHRYGVSNWHMDLKKAVDSVVDAFHNAEEGKGFDAFFAQVDVVGANKDNEYGVGVKRGDAEIFFPQVTQETGLRKLPGIREGNAFVSAANVTSAMANAAERIAEEQAA